MTGFNMPPGCSVSDIPGNTASDEAAEALAERISSAIEKLELGSVSENDQDEIVFAMMKLMGEAYSEGYAQGRSDEGLAEEMARSESFDEAPEEKSEIESFGSGSRRYMANETEPEPTIIFAETMDGAVAEFHMIRATDPISIRRMLEDEQGTQ